MIEWNGIKIVETDCLLPVDRVKPYREAFDNLIDKYKTIDYTKPKIAMGNKAWQAVRARQDCASKTAGR